MPDDFSLSVENIERDFIFRRSLEIVINHRARRRVVTHRLAFVEFLRVMQAQCGLRLVKNEIRVRGLRAQLPKRRDIIQHPKRAAMRRHHQVIVFHEQVMNRRSRQIQLQRLPVRARIERNENAQLSAGIKQSGLFRVLAHGMHECAVRNSINDGVPGFAEIGCFNNVRLKIVEFMSVDRGISSLAVVRRCFDQIDCAPFRHFRTDVAPMGAVIRADLNQSVVCSSPKRTFVHR